MRESLSKQLQELSNPRPTEFHPDQEDWDHFTRARVSQSRTYDDEGKLSGSSGRSSRVRSSKARKRVSELDSDPRYAGKPVSRKELYRCWDEGWFTTVSDNGGLLILLNHLCCRHRGGG